MRKSIKFKNLWPLLFLAFIFSSCATGDNNPSSYLFFSDMPPLKQAHPAQRKSGKLIVEEFKDYRTINEDAPIVTDCRLDEFKNLKLVPGRAKCKKEMVEAIKTYQSSPIREAMKNIIARTMSEDIRQRRLFDSVEYVTEANENYPGASWRLVGLVSKVDQTFVYTDLVPITHSYKVVLGTPLGYVQHEIEIELRLESLPDRRTVLQKKVYRKELSKGFNLYDRSTNNQDWKFSSYNFMRTLRLMADEFISEAANQK